MDEESDPFVRFDEKPKDELNCCTEDELTQLVSLLSKLAKSKEFNADFIKSKKFRDVRKALSPFVEIIQENKFSGGSEEDYKKKMISEKFERGLKASAKMKDLQLINATNLRNARIQRKNELIQTDQLLRIPDGIGSVDIHSKALLIKDHSAEDKPADISRPQVNQARSCYVCKLRFFEIHEFYDQLCPSCAALNWLKRNELVNLEGKTALLTGARVKIGYHIGLKLLRSG